MSDDLPRVCVVTHPLGSAGENATRTLLEILSDLTAVTLITAELPADSAIRQQHEVVELTRKGAAQSSVVIAAARFILNQLWMCRAIALRDEEVVLFFGATAYLLPVLFAKAVGKTVVLEPRGDVPLTLRLTWERRLPTPVARILAMIPRGLEVASYVAADAIVAYTPAMADELGLDRFEHKLYADGARYVDTEAFRPEIPFDQRDPVVGFVGRLDEEKGIREFVEVARLLPERVAFRFVGDGPLRPWIESQLAQQIEAGQVTVTGWVDHDDVPDELNRLRLLLLMSRPTEGLPTTILEAMSCGTPVFATPVSGVPDVVREDETGFLMENTDSAAVAAQIEAILNRSDLVRLSECCRELIKHQYSYDAAVDRYREILAAIGS